MAKRNLGPLLTQLADLVGHTREDNLAPMGIEAHMSHLENVASAASLAHIIGVPWEGSKGYFTPIYVNDRFR